MEAEFSHLPVMPREVVELLLPVPAGLFVDCTVGGGGHAGLLLDARPDIRLLGIDRDADAVDAARGRLAPFGSRVAGGARTVRGARRPRRRARRGETSDGDPDGSGREQPAVRSWRAGLLVPVRRAPRHAHGREAGPHRGRRREQLRRSRTGERDRALRRRALRASHRASDRRGPSARHDARARGGGARRDPGAGRGAAGRTPRGARSRRSAWR